MISREKYENKAFQLLYLFWIQTEILPRRKQSLYTVTLFIVNVDRFDLSWIFYVSSPIRHPPNLKIVRQQRTTDDYYAS